jgi:hypothetical protein
MLIKTLSDAERFVASQQNKGKDCRWDGWDIVFFNPSKHAVTSPKGLRRGGRFGFEKRIIVDDLGHWNI